MRWHPVTLVLSFVFLATATACIYEDNPQSSQAVPPLCTAGMLRATVEPIIKTPYVHFHWLITVRNPSADECTLPVRPSVSVLWPDGNKLAANDAPSDTDLREIQSQQALQLAPGQAASARILYVRASDMRGCLASPGAGFEVQLSVQDDVILLPAPTLRCITDAERLAVTAFVPGSG